MFLIVTISSLLQHFLNKGMITLEDIRNGLALGARLSQLETAAHVSFILESTISPILDKTDRVTLKLKQGATENERLFIQAITNILTMKASGKSFPTIDRFKRDCALYLCPKQKGNGNGDSNLVSNDQSLSLRPGYNTVVDDPTSILQAEARNRGAEFLFPQNTHDKVLINTVIILIKSSDFCPIEMILLTLFNILCFLNLSDSCLYFGGSDDCPSPFCGNPMSDRHGGIR